MLTSDGAQYIVNALAFTRLSTLNMSDNNITNLAPPSAPLKFLKRMILTPGNQNLNPKSGLLELSPEDVVEKLNAVSKKTVTRNNRVPIHVVGHANSGKTALVRALASGGAFDGFIEDATMSPAVDILTRSFTQRGKRVELRFLDYKGSANGPYAAAHRPFFQHANDGLVILCWRPSRTPSDDASQEPITLVRDWLAMINLLSPHAKIMLVATHADDLTAEELDAQCSKMQVALQQHAQLQKTKHEENESAIRSKLLDDMGAEDRNTLLRDLFHQQKTAKHPRIINGRSICVSSMTGDGFAALQELLLNAARSVPIYEEIIPRSFIGPSTRPTRVLVCAARTLNATGQSRVTLSLQKEHSSKSRLWATPGEKEPN